MPIPSKNPGITPIPVQSSESEFTQFILPHLSMPRRGPKGKFDYHRLFNLILWVLYTGVQWKSLPVPKDYDGKAKILLLPKGLKALKRLANLTGLNVHRSYLNLDGGFDSRSIVGR